MNGRRYTGLIRASSDAKNTSPQQRSTACVQLSSGHSKDMLLKSLSCSILTRMIVCVLPAHGRLHGALAIVLARPWASKEQSLVTEARVLVTPRNFRLCPNQGWL